VRCKRSAWIVLQNRAGLKTLARRTIVAPCVTQASVADDHAETIGREVQEYTLGRHRTAHRLPTKNPLFKQVAWLSVAPFGATGVRR